MSSPDSGNDVRPGFFDAMSGPVGGGMGGGEANRPNWIPGVGTPFPQYQAALSSFTPPTAPAPAVPGSPWPYILAPVPALVPVQTTSAWAPNPGAGLTMSPAAMQPTMMPMWPPAGAATFATPWGTPESGPAPGWVGPLADGPWSAPPAPFRELGPPDTPFESMSGQPISPGWFGAAAGEGRGERRKRKKSRRRSRSVDSDRCMHHHSAWWGHGGWDRWNGPNSALGLYDEHDRPYPFPAYAQDDLFDERNLARRPRDWRADYTPRGISLATYLPRIGKGRSDVREWTDPIRRTLDPLFLWQPSTPPIHFDLCAPAFSPASVTFLSSPAAHPANPIDFCQLAVRPPTPFMRLYHPKLPWYVDIRATTPNGITVGDVLEQLHVQLHTQVHPRHFWNEVLGDAGRASVSGAFTERCGGDEALFSRGVVQLDFLGRRVVFEGLTKGLKGMWEIKASKVD